MRERRMRHLVPCKYFLQKNHVDKLINLVDYLNLNEIGEKQLEDENILRNIIREGMGRFVGIKIPLCYLKSFKSTIVHFKIDYLKTVNLYRLNYGILAVASVKYILYPDQNYEKYLQIYACSRSTAMKMYNKLCGVPENQKQTVNIAISARSFFKCVKFLDQLDFLKMIRVHLRNIEIDNYELSYIREASIQFIDNNKPQQPVEPKCTSRKGRNNTLLITTEYFLNKLNAISVINLQEYLIVEEIEEENLEDRNLLIYMIKKVMQKSAGGRSPIERNKFKNTLLTLTIDYLKLIHLYRMNCGILLVACIEIVLYPEKDDKTYLKIYRCEQHSACKYYNELRCLPELEKQDLSIVKSARSFFNCTTFLTKPDFLKAIRAYLKAIGSDIDNDELKYIREFSIKIINDNAAKNRVKPS
ncbi:hypothetical protein TKK_0003829 [Trichogramma kaykai]